MNLRQARFRRPRERVVPWAVAAVVLAVAGAALSIWRPTAPAPGPPTELATFAPEVLEAVAAYRTPRYAVVVAASLLGVAVPVGLAVTRPGRRLVARLAGAPTHSAGRAALVAAVVMAATSVAVLPLSVWSRVIQDGRWGFRTQSAVAWSGEWLTVSATRWGGYALGAAVVVVAIRRWPRSWPFRLTVVGPAVAALAVMLHPVAFLPLLMPMGPLPDGPQRDVVEEVMAAAGEPDLRLVVAEASRRTTRVNAVATGLGPTEQVVLYDTLLELPPDRIRAVVAHELAHHEHRDLERGIALAATGLLPSLLLLRRLLEARRTRELVGARGPTDPRLVAPALALVAVVLLVGQPLANHVSRQYEAAADARTVELTGDPATVIRLTRVFTVRDLAPPHAPDAFRAVYATHPSVRERIEQAVALADDPDVLPDLATLEREEAALSHPAVTQGPP